MVTNPLSVLSRVPNDCGDAAFIGETNSKRAVKCQGTKGCRKQIADLSKLSPQCEPPGFQNSKLVEIHNDISVSLCHVISVLD